MTESCSLFSRVSFIVPLDGVYVCERERKREREERLRSKERRKRLPSRPAASDLAGQIVL